MKESSKNYDDSLTLYIETFCEILKKFDLTLSES